LSPPDEGRDRLGSNDVERQTACERDKRAVEE
jgi:hypothetical protein